MADCLINGGYIVIHSEVVLQVVLGHSFGQGAAEFDARIGLAHSDEVALHYAGKPAVRGILFPSPAESLAAEQGKFQVEGLAAGIQFHWVYPPGSRDTAGDSTDCFSSRRP